MSSPINTLSVQPRYATVAAASTDSRTNTPIGIYFKELYNYNFFFFYFIIFNNLNIILLLLLLLLLSLLLLLIFNIISLMINLIVVTSQNISTTQIKTSEPSSIQQNNENSSNSQNQSKTSLSKQVKRNFYIINIKD